MIGSGRWLLSVLLWLPVGAGCDNNSPIYVGPAAALEVGGMTDGGAAPTSATGTLEIAFRTPTPDEQQGLDRERMQLGFATPWLRRSDLAIEVLYTITNLEDKPGTAQILVNGANEFTDYNPEAIRSILEQMAGGQDEEEIVVLPLIQGIPFMVGALATAEGVVREDDFAEAELDLDAIGRWAAAPAAVLINRSESSGAGLEQVPVGEIVPALFRVAVTCAASTHMRCQYLVRVRDRQNRLWSGTGPKFMPMPTNYQPPPMGN